MSPRPTLRRAWRRIREAGPAGRRFAARAWLAAIPVELSLATLGLARTRHWIDAATPTSSKRPRRNRAVTVAEGERLVRGAFRLHALPGHCLARSLVQYLLHRQDGVPARIVFGVRRDEGLDAHAWVEPDPGEPIETGFARLEPVERRP